jgi:hypothetical protein
MTKQTDFDDHGVGTEESLKLAIEWTLNIHLIMTFLCGERLMANQIHREVKA